jgi:hypothetical protein
MTRVSPNLGTGIADDTVREKWQRSRIFNKNSGIPAGNLGNLESELLLLKF